MNPSSTAQPTSLLQRVEQKEVIWYQFKHLAGYPHLLHAITSREGGDGNLSLKNGDRQTSLANRRRLCEAVGVSWSSLVVAEQVHGTEVAWVEGHHRGAGALSAHTAIAGVDALVTATPEVPLLVLSADCPMLLLYDPQAQILGLVHASWRCTVGEIVPKTVALMEEGGAQGKNLVVGLAPSIGPCCYEVGKEVIEKVQALANGTHFLNWRQGHCYFDLWSANRAQLCSCGVLAENIIIAGVCTLCEQDRFYSYRAQKEAAGRFGLLAQLLPNFSKTL